MSDEFDFDPWEGSSGLLGDVDVTVLDAVFCFDAQYNNGQTCILKFTFQNDSDPGSEPQESFFPCGNGWEPSPDGKTMRREDGTARKVNKSTAYYEWFANAAELAGEVLKARGNPFHTETWVGTRWHIERQERNFKIQGEERRSERIIPTAFLGVANGAAPVATTVTAQTSGVPSGGNGISPGLKAKLTAIAKSAGTHEAFMEQAFGVEGVMNNAPVEALVMDVSDTGLYAQANA